MRIIVVLVHLARLHVVVAALHRALEIARIPHSRLVALVVATLAREAVTILAQVRVRTHLKHLLVQTAATLVQVDVLKIVDLDVQIPVNSHA